MSKQLSNYFISLVRSACLKVFWRKKSLATFLRQYHISEEFVSLLFKEKTKAEVLSEIFDRLSRDQTEEKQEIVLEIAKDLSGMVSFPDLEGWEDSKTKISEARRAVVVLREQYERLSVLYIDTGDKEIRHKARENRDACVSFEEQIKVFAERLNRIASAVGQQQAGYEFEDWIYDFAVFHTRDLTDDKSMER